MNQQNPFVQRMQILDAATGYDMVTFDINRDRKTRPFRKVRMHLVFQGKKMILVDG